MGISFLATQQEAELLVLIDGTNNVIETVRRRDGVVVGTYGRPRREVGEFRWVHVAKFDSRGNLYSVSAGVHIEKSVICP